MKKSASMFSVGQYAITHPKVHTQDTNNWNKDISDDVEGNNNGTAEETCY